MLREAMEIIDSQPGGLRAGIGGGSWWTALTRGGKPGHADGDPRPAAVTALPP